MMNINEGNLLSFIIPAYNEAENIEATIAAIAAHLVSAQITDYEILVVDDHSVDYTMYDMVTELAKRQPQVRIIRLSRNSGSHTAIRAGLALARGDAVAVVAADGQDAPAALPAMLQKWRDGAQIIFAQRRVRQEPWQIKLPALLFYRVLAFFDREIPSDMDVSRIDFYLLDRCAVDAINTCAERCTSLFGLILRSGFRRDFVEYDRPARKAGNSKWSFYRRLSMAKSWIFSFSGLPLRLASVLGFTIASIGFFYALFVIFSALSGDPISGWASLMVVTLLLGGGNMVLVGLIGEYLWLNVLESKRRPLFFVENSNFVATPAQLPEEDDK